MQESGRLPSLASLPKGALQLLLVILVTAGGLRAIGLGSPPELVFDETHYVPSARVMADLVPREAHFDPKPWSGQPLIARTPDPNFSHPPIAKLLMALSIKVFGDTPLAWRLPSWLFGMLSLVCFAYLTLRLTASPPTMLLATTFLALDFMHLVLSRTAMLDIYLFAFSIFAMTVNVKYLTGCKCRWPAVWTGLLLGLAIGVKESAVTVALATGVAALGFGPGTWKDRVRHVAVMAGMTCAGYSLIAVYYMAHGYSIVEWLQFRIEVTRSLVQPLAEHRYTSRVWGWPLNYKPVWFFWKSDPEVGGGNLLRGIVCLGNPVVWVGFVLASYLLFADWWATRRDQARSPLIPVDPLTRAGAFVLVWYATLYLPMFAILWRREGFLYHHFAATAPMALGLALAVTMWGRRARARTKASWAPAIAVGLALGAFFAYAPVLIGLGFHEPYMRFLRSIVSM